MLSTIHGLVVDLTRPISSAGGEGAGDVGARALFTTLDSRDHSHCALRIAHSRMRVAIPIAVCTNISYGF